jgi:formylglycine-generating enzyme required for sulfatase activity
MKKCVFVSSVLVALSVVAAPEIENLSVSQNRDRMLAISFSLTEKAIVTMDILTNDVSIGASNYWSIRDTQSADDAFPANRIVAQGDHVWVWRPVKEWPGHSFTSNVFRVSLKAWSLDAPPDYMVIDSASISNAPHFYATAADLPEGGIKTADPDDAEAVAELTNDVYRTTKLILRKIPAAGVKWRMGSPTNELYRQDGETPHYVTLTNDYYVSIYLLTVTQSRMFFGFQEAATINIKPKFNLSYLDARGSYTNGFCWPGDGHSVSNSSGFGYMRRRTGLQFDFLTEAEWEFACRAGTEGKWCNNEESPDSVAWLNMSAGHNIRIVGLKAPNSWGLYDMHGLVNEWVLDQYGAYPSTAVTAPVGATDNIVNRILRGGPQSLKWQDSWNANISTRSAFRRSYDGSARSDTAPNGFGGRISCPAALPDWLR